MAWYDNLQKPDYAGYYKQQGDIYSNLINSLAKIGTGYLEGEAKAAAGKKIADLRNTHTIIKTPEVREELPPPMNTLGLPSETYQNVPISSIRGRLITPATTTFDEQGYIRALSEILTGGSQYEQDAANRAYSVYKMQNDIERQKIQDEQKNRPTIQELDPKKQIVSVDSTGKINVIRDATQETPKIPEQKMQILFNTITNKWENVDVGKEIPTHYISYEVWKSQNERIDKAKQNKIINLQKNLDAETNYYNTIVRYGLNQNDIQKSLEKINQYKKELDKLTGVNGKKIGGKDLFNQ